MLQLNQKANPTYYGVFSAYSKLDIWRINMSFICTAWNNGKHHVSGAGHGLKVLIAYRDKYFQKEWKSVTLELPANGGTTKAKLNTDKSSFWNSTCHELINQEIRRWLRRSGLAPWSAGHPPKIAIEVIGERHFKVVTAND